MRYIYLVAIFFLSVSLGAQDMQWQRTFGGKHAEYLFDGLRTLDYGFMMVGGALSESGDVPVHYGGFDGFVTKISEFGDKEWTRVWGGRGDDIIRCISATRDGGYLLAVSSSSDKSGNKKLPSVGLQDIWLIKINIAGEEEWQQVIGGPADDIPVRITQTRDGGYLIGAITYSDASPANDSLENMPGIYIKQSPHYGHADYWIIKLNHSGLLEWEVTLGGRQVDMISGITELKDGTIVAAGFSNSMLSGTKKFAPKGKNDWWIVALDMKGQLLWQLSEGDQGNDETSSVVALPDGSFAVGGFMAKNEDSEKTENTDMVIIRYNEAGERIWKKTYHQSEKDISRDLIRNKDGTLILGGFSMTVNKQKTNEKQPVKRNEEDFLLIKVNSDGEELWRKSFGGPGKEDLSRIIELRDGGYALLGTKIHRHSKTANTDFLIMKLSDPDKPEVKPLPLEAIPNPAGSYTQAVIGMPYEKGKVMVTDLHGNILDSFEISKNRIIPIRLEGYRPGIYIIHIEVDRMAGSIKVIKQ